MVYAGIPKHSESSGYIADEVWDMPLEPWAGCCTNTWGDRCEMKCEMRCETATIWIQICSKRKAFQTVAFCGRLLRLQSSKGTLLCVIEVFLLLGMVAGMKSSQGAYSGMYLGETKVLLSYLVFSVANVAIAFGFTAMYTTTRKKLWEATWKSEFVNRLW